MRRSMQKLSQRISLWRGIIATLVMTGLLMAGWMAVSPELHEHLHHHSNDAGHECLVTTIFTGGVDHAIDVPVMTAPHETVWVQVRTKRSPWVQPLFLKGSLLERAPPVIA